MGDMADWCLDQALQDENGHDPSMECPWCGRLYRLEQNDDGTIDLFTPSGRVHRCKQMPKEDTRG